MGHSRLVLFPLPLRGHITPMLQLATLLHFKGFSITMIHTQYNSPDPSNFPSLTFHFINEGFSDEASQPPLDPFSVLSVLNTNCLEPFRDCLSRVLSDHHDGLKVSCLIVDPMWQFTTAVADSFSLPRMVLRTASMFAFLVYDSLPILREKGYFRRQETRSDEVVSELPPLKLKDLPTEQNHIMLNALVKETKSSLGIICNTFKELESSALATLHQVLPIPVFSIGPLHNYSPTCAVSSLKTQDLTSISWQNTQAPKSVLYVSFGSLATVSEAEFQEIAWGMANTMQPFLWVVRSGLIQGSEAIPPLPEGYVEMVGSRGHIIKWAPQKEILAHPAVGGFWSHCGWNSTIESVSEGVPMICQPFFGEQAINARNVIDNWRIGLQLEKGMKRGGIEQAIRKLMVEDVGEAMRNRAASLKGKAALCLMEGGSYYKSIEKLISYLLSL